MQQSFPRLRRMCHLSAPYSLKATRNLQIHKYGFHPFESICIYVCVYLCILRIFSIHILVLLPRRKTLWGVFLVEHSRLESITLPVSTRRVTSVGIENFPIVEDRNTNFSCTQILAPIKTNPYGEDERGGSSCW